MGSKSPSFVVVKVSKEPLLSQIGCRWQKKHSQLSRAEKLRTRTNEQRGRERRSERAKKIFLIALEQKKIIKPPKKKREALREKKERRKILSKEEKKKN